MQDIVSSLGQVTAVIGAQWGDEGKGKLIDILAPHFDVVARACGGANAGHTVYADGKKHVFHLLPSGALHENVQIVLGAGMVIHIPTLLGEIQALNDMGIDIIPRLHISAAAHIVTEEHKRRDAELEEGRERKIGTTKRGIGPAYGDKALRTGIQIKNEKLKIKNCLIPNLVEFMNDLLRRGKRILIEGAQGTLLDIDHGTYPYVTSSSTTAAGALQGLGLPPKAIDSCIGVAKAYCTRVGEGPFPTEIDSRSSDSKIAERLRERGGEYGATTGRSRRIGWLSIPDLKYAAMLNGFTCWNITKMDVLDGEEGIYVGIDGSAREERSAVLPNRAGTIARVRPPAPHVRNMEYKTFTGWQTSTSIITDFEKLSIEAQDYIRFIEHETGIPVRFIGTGPERGDCISS